MSVSKRFALAPILAALVAWLPAASADAGGHGYRTLAGLEGVALTVGPFSDAFVRNGITEDGIRARVQRRLEAAGIPTLSESAFQSADSTGLATLALRANPDGTRFYFYGWSLSVADKTPVDASGAGYVTRELWSDGGTGVAIPTDTDAMLAELDALVTRFIDDYRRQH